MPSALVSRGTSCSTRDRGQAEVIQHASNESTFPAALLHTSATTDRSGTATHPRTPLLDPKAARFVCRRVAPALRRLKEMVMATVSISHPTTHNTVSHDENYLGGSSAGSPEELCPKSWKWSDASGADACRQRQPSDHHRITTNITSSTCYRTKKKLRTLIFVTTTVLLVHILRSMCAVLARIYLYTHSTMRTFTYSSEASF